HDFPHKARACGESQAERPPQQAQRRLKPSNLPQTQERERAKTRSLSKTIGCPMIDKDPQMIR
ncbi:hypothetical protein, partial [uncultured Senegalimassilia sp.]|uniref:hypothetical protein n=1 Tax=uncultured Senegalimassilia sp. TaxID=1714350 RepID=UPI0025D04C04